MDIRFYVDPETQQPHIFNHGVTEQEVHQAFRKPAEDRPGAEGTRVLIGQTAAGRYLRVIYSRDAGHNSVFVITAYDLRGKPLKAFRRRRKKR
jgi:hypothetical protein